MFFSNKKDSRKVFLDYASSTPIDPGVLHKMSLYLESHFANPRALYSQAEEAKEEMKIAKSDIANVFSCKPDEIYFTSGGTESNNLAIMGVFYANKDKGFKPHFITTEIEHSSVLEVFKEIEDRGGEVTYLKVSSEGLFSLEELKNSIKKETVLVSIAYANNEIGIINPIKEVSKIIKEWKREKETNFPYFHCDACQAVLYLSLDVSKNGLDMMTLDGLKMYGPRNCGILYIKNEVQIKPIMYGGGHQRGIRSGTEDISSVLGMAYALDLAENLKEEESKRLLKIRDYAIGKILEKFEGASLNGSRTQRLPNNINICFPDKDAEFLVVSLDVFGIAVSYSSSCNTLKEDSSSFVIKALDKKDCSASSLRITLGRDTRVEDIDYLVEKLEQIIK